jgi:hypothetical protein
MVMLFIMRNAKFPPAISRIFSWRLISWNKEEKPKKKKNDLQCYAQHFWASFQQSVLHFQKIEKTLLYILIITTI